MKGDLAAIKYGVQNLTVMQTNSLCTTTEMPGPNRPSSQSKQDEEKMKKSGPSNLPVEINSLPLLSTLNHSANPLLEVWKLWTEGLSGSRPLKDINEGPKLGFKRYPEGIRAISETAKKIRHICWMIELTILDGVTDPFERLLPAYKRMRSLNKTAKEIQRQLKQAGLSTPGRIQTVEAIFNNENYRSAELFWKDV